MNLIRSLQKILHSESRTPFSSLLCFFLFLMLNAQFCQAQSIPTLVKSNDGSILSIHPSAPAVSINNRTLFARDFGSSIQLWSSMYGDSLSTFKIADSVILFENSTKLGVTFNGNFWFIIHKNGNQVLCSTDGSATNMTQISSFGQIDHLTPSSSKLYFSASLPTGSGQELWYTDGISTDEISIGTSANPSNPNNLSPLTNGKIFFNASYHGSGDRELWTSDGTTQGTQIFNIFNPDSTIGSNPSKVFDLGNGRFVFFATDSSGSRRIWTTDGSLIIPYSGYLSNPSESLSVVFGNQLIFPIQSANFSHTLYSFNGSILSQFGIMGIYGDTSIPLYTSQRQSTYFYWAKNSNGYQVLYAHDTILGTNEVALDLNSTSSSIPNNWIINEGAQFDSLGHMWLRTNINGLNQIVEIWRDSSWHNISHTNSFTHTTLTAPVFKIGNHIVFPMGNPSTPQLFALDQAPTMTPALPDTLGLGTPIGSPIGVLHSSDPDLDILQINFGADSINFKVVNDTIYTRQKLNKAPGPYTFNVNIKDPMGLSDSFSKTMTIKANLAPSFTSPNQSFNLLENPGPQGPIWATMINKGASWEINQSLIFEFKLADSSNWVKYGGTNGVFQQFPSIDTGTGQLVFELKQNIYSFDTNSFKILVRLKDNGGTANGGTDTSEFHPLTIHVANINKAPQFNTNQMDTLISSQYNAIETIQNWLLAPSVGDSIENLDSNQKIISAIFRGIDTSLFNQYPTIDLSTGNISFNLKSTVPKGTYPFSILIRDNYGTSHGGCDTVVLNAFFTVLGPPNQAPSFSVLDSNIKINENEGLRNLLWATAISPGASWESNQKLHFEIQLADSNVWNQLGGLSAVFSQTPKIDSSTGKILFAVKPNRYSYLNTSFDFKVRLKDDGGTDRGGVDTSSFQSLHIIVANINKAPLFSQSIPDTIRSIKPNQLEMIANWLPPVLRGDSLENADTNQKIVSAIFSNIDTTLFIQKPSIDLSNGQISFITNPALPSGIYQLHLVIKDNGGTANGGIDSLVSNIPFKVTALPNQAPSFIPQSNEIHLLENAGNQRISQWAQSISVGPAWENKQIPHFEIQALDTTLLNQLGGTTNIFSQVPHIDSISGDLTFAIQPNMYAYNQGSFDLKIRLRDNGGTDNNGIDSSAWVTYSIYVANINKAPHFSSKLPDTIRSFQAGLPEIINQWLPNISVGDTLENHDPNQQIQSVAFTDSLDTTWFIQMPQIDLSTGNLSFELQPFAQGSRLLHLRIKDNAGTANGGTDSSIVIIPITEKAHRPDWINTPPQLPNFDSTQIPYITISTNWQFTQDTNFGIFQRGRNQILLLSPQQNNLFLRNVQDSTKTPSNWVVLNWLGGIPVHLDLGHYGLSLGIQWTDWLIPQLNNANFHFLISDSAGNTEQQKTISSTQWAWAFCPAGQHRIQSQLLTPSGDTIISTDTIISVSDSVLSQFIPGDSNLSPWYSRSIGLAVRPGQTVYHWISSNSMDPIYARYQGFDSTSKALNPSWGGWYYTEKNTTLDFHNNYPTDSVGIDLLALNEGWNQVSNPYPFYLADQAVQNSDSLTCWIWNRQTSDYIAINTAPGPFQTCWVNVIKDRHLQFQPIPAIQIKSDSINITARPKAMPSKHYSLSLTARQFSDLSNYFGWDTIAHQLSKIPAPTQGRIQLAFVNNSSLLQEQFYADTNQNTWTILMSSGISGLSQGQLTINGLESIHQDGFNLFYRNQNSTWQNIQGSIPVTMTQSGIRAQLRILPSGQEPPQGSLQRVLFAKQNLDLDFPDGFEPDHLEIWNLKGGLIASIALTNTESTWTLNEDIPHFDIAFVRLSNLQGYHGKAQSLVKP